VNEEALAHWGWGGAVAPGGETKEEELWYEALYSVRGAEKFTVMKDPMVCPLVL